MFLHVPLITNTRSLVRTIGIFSANHGSSQSPKARKECDLADYRPDDLLTVSFYRSALSALHPCACYVLFFFF